MTELEFDPASSDYAEQHLQRGSLVVAALRAILVFLSGVHLFLNIVQTAWLLFVLWSLVQRKNWARLYALFMGICALGILPYRVKTGWAAFFNDPFGNASLQIAVYWLYHVSVLWLAYKLLDPNIRALYKSEPSKKSSSNILGVVAITAFVVGLLANIPAVQNGYASWLSKRMNRKHSEAQKLTDIMVTNWGFAEPVINVGDVQVIRFDRVDEGQRVTLLVGPPIKPIPVEAVVGSLEAVYVPKSLGSYPVVLPTRTIMVDQVFFPKDMLGDKNGLVSRWSNLHHNIVVLGYAPAGLAVVPKNFSSALYEDFLSQLIANNNDIPNDDLETSELLSGAQTGDALAQYRLGVRYWAGLGIKQDDSEAFKWFQKAADLGLAQAQFNIAFSYVKGKGVNPNPQQAFTWYQRSAQQGLPIGQLLTGRLFITGSGVQQDYRQAFFWLTVAKNNHVNEAQSWCEKLKSQLSADQVQQTEQEANNWQWSSDVAGKKQAVALPVIMSDSGI